MSVVAVASVKAGPGATTTALLLAAMWGEPHPVVVEADPDGGSLAARCGVPAEPGLASLAAASRHSGTGVSLPDHGHHIRGGPLLVAGPTAADEAVAALALSGPLATCLHAASDDVIVDCGRLRPGSPSLALALDADLLLIVCRPRLDELQHVGPRLAALVDAGSAPHLVLVGSRPYPPDEVAEVFDTPVMAVLADDPLGADTLPLVDAGNRAFRRTALARTGQTLVDAVREALPPPAVTRRPDDRPAPTEVAR